MEWLWVVDWFTRGFGVIYVVRRTLACAQTPYQGAGVFEVEGLGRVLVLDGKLQSAEMDEWVYHEALVHPAMVLHERPRRVLILGGGEGATLREVLRYGVERAVMVDIDREVVEFCRRHLPEWGAGAFEDPRAELVIAEGRGYVEGTDEEFDVVIADLPEPLRGGPAVRLYTREFYEAVYRRLGNGGVFVTQATSVLHLREVVSRVYAALKEVFPCVRMYRAYVPSFASDWAFVIASKGPDPAALSPEEVDRRVAERVRGELRFYDGETHVHMFALPKYVRRELERGVPSTDGDPATLEV